LSEFPLKFEEPYPVYRGLRVPVWEEGRPVSVRRVTDEDRRAFADAMARLRRLLEKVARLARLGAGEEELLNLLADAIVIFLRAPLVQEVSPVAPTPLKAHALLLLAPRLRENLWSQDLYEFARRLSKLSPEDLEFAGELFEPETAELVYRLWIAFPADTRPGYNASSLLAHTLMTSAIAWALAAARGRSGRELAVLRLSALLHDLGKAVNPERHYEASEELARWLLQGILDEQALGEVLREVREHHLRESELREADRLASSADRLEKLVERTIGGKIGRMEQLLGGKRDEWGFWRSVWERRGELAREGLAAEDPLRELTEEFLREVPEAARRGEPGWEAREELSLVLVDVASIQDFVLRSQEIRVVAAASHLVELVVHAHFFEFLRNNGVRAPPEAVLYAGGGNILLLLPSSLAGRVGELADLYIRQYARPLRLAVAAAPFTDYYPAASAELSRRMYEGKHKVELRSRLSYQEPSERGLCRMCYSDWATTSVSTPEGDVSVCETCKELYEAGSEMHFRPKWERLVRVGRLRFTPKEVFREGQEEVPWSEVSKYIMEVIAGHEPEEVREGRFKQVRDYAVVKFDGNAMTSFIHEAISFTDAIERSFRIDVALKRAYFRALEALYEGVERVAGADAAEREVARVYLGTIYMGGDDGFLLAPSWAAVPLAHFIAEEFSRQLGLERGLRVAVAAGPARMSLWALLDCASSIMGKAGDVLRMQDPTAKESVLGAVAFDLFEAGSPSGASAVERMERLSWRARDKPRQRDKGIDGLQPYLMRRQDLEGKSIPEFWRVLAPLLVEVRVQRWGEAESFEMHAELFRKAYEASRARGAGAEELRCLRNAILRSWSAVSGSEYWRELLLIYLRREVAWRQSKEGGGPLEEREEKLLEAYRRLERMALLSLGDRGMGPVPLADALTLVKLLRGGAEW
jgi:hypothetical protein